MENQSLVGMDYGGGNKLCKSCAKLPLTEEEIERFEEDIKQDKKKEWRFSMDTFIIGTVSETRQRLDCPMCRLLTATFDNDPQGGRTQGIDESSATCTFSLRWEGERKGFCSSDGLGSQGTRLAFVRANDGSAFGHGRRIQTEQIDTELVSSWLRRCQHEHGNQCGPQGRPDQGSASHASKLPLSLINVRRRCIIEVGGPSDYVALSYVWGKVKTLRLLKENRVSLMKPFALDSLRNMIPRTILDAMDLVGRLGFLYLWVDALCIAQDDENELALEIQRMDLIYENSLFTIIAADGVDADAGLPGVQPNSRQNHQVLEQVTENTSLVALYELDDLLTTPVYSTRGWTYVHSSKW
jgi:hypothetical protein